MKVLHINANETGSTGKIISDISIFMHSEGHESVLCAPKITNHDTGFMKKFEVSLPYEQGIYRRISHFTGIVYGFAPLSTHKIIRIIKNEAPDVIHLHSINSNVCNIYSLLDFLKKSHIPVVVTNHAEFLYTGSCAFPNECDKWKTGCGKCPTLKRATASLFLDRTHCAWKKMRKAFDGFERIAIANVSPWVTSRATLSPILNQYKHYTVLNGINVSVFNNEQKEKVSAKTEKTFLTVTSSFSDASGHLKGGEYLIELARRFKNDNVKFVVAGPNNTKSSLPENILALGSISDQNELAEWYRRADLTVLTSKRETFGMAVAESLCCGTPVVGFCSGGSESVAIDEFSVFVNFADIDKLESIIRTKWMNFKTPNISEKISETAMKKYAGEQMAREYLEIYKSLISDRP